MAKYDVYEFGADKTLVVDVQTDLLDELNTRIVIPILPVNEAPLPARFLNPTFTIDGEQYIFVTQFLSAAPARQLSKAVGNLVQHSDEITHALDMVFQGFWRQFD